MANFEFLTHNFVNTTTLLTAPAGSLTFSNIFDRDNDTKFESVGYSAANFEFSIKFNTSKYISRIGLKNINWKEFWVKNNNVLIDLKQRNDGTYNMPTELVSATQFEAGTTITISIATLNNDNFVIAYTDYTDGQKGKFVIYTEAGVEVVAPTQFEAGNTQYVNVILLANTNFCITYADISDGYKGKFCIYTQAGVEVVAPTTFNAVTTYYIHSCLLVNNNFVIVYKAEGDAGKGKFCIYDQDGVQVVAPVTFESIVAYYCHVSKLANGNFVIAYNDFADGQKGKFIIYTSAGVAITAQLPFEAGVTSDISIMSLANTNFVIAYRDNSDSGKGKFCIYTQAGVVVKNVTEFESDSTFYCALTLLLGIGFCITFRDHSDGKGKFVIYDENGTIVIPTTIFKNSATNVPNCTTLNNNNLIIAYNDTADASKGKFVIWNMNYILYTRYNDTTTSTYLNNSQTNQYFVFDTLSSSEVTFNINSTMIDNEEKSISELFIGDRWLTLPFNPSYNNYKVKRGLYEKLHIMSDGGVIKYVITENFDTEITLDYVSTTTHDILLDMYRDSSALNFVPTPTSTAWEGDIVECNWVGSFDFEEYQGNPEILGFKGKIKLQETPK